MNDKKMKMRIIYLFVLTFLCPLVEAQERSIHFEDGTFQTALEKAKKESKLLFVDCYTSWCGPCKMLARDVFTNNEVADYFNEHFISLKVDCEKGEGPEIKKRFNVSGYPTLLFINGKGEVVNKIVGASRQPYFLENVKKGLDTQNSLFAKEAKYKSGCRDQAFLVDLIMTYQEANESKKAVEVSRELLKSLTEAQLLTEEMWNIVSYYYVSPYGSEWWNFIIEHADDYEQLVGKEALAKKIGGTMHPYVFGYAYGKRKMEDKSGFEQMKALVEKYQPKQKEVLNCFIELGESASFDDFNGYFKTVQKVLPRMDISEHYRFWANAFKNLYDKSNDRQKKYLFALLKDSQVKSNKYISTNYEKFIEQFDEKIRDKNLK